MNYAQLVAFADNLTSVCPMDKDGKTTLDVLRHTIMEHPHLFPNRTKGQPAVANSDVVCDWLDGILEIPSDILSFVWGGVVFLALTPFVFFVATCSNKERQVWLGLWLRDRIRVAMRGRDSLNTQTETQP